jgi:hypothetical protein
MTIKKKATPKSKAAALRPVLVTTQHRGIFFGLTSAKDGAETVRLSQCRNVLYWPQECKGFLGLAANGPKFGAKLGPAAESVELRNITSVIDLNDASAALFAAFPVWS